MLTRYARMGDTPTDAYTTWTAQIKALLQSVYGDQWRAHGAAVVMPSNVPPGMQAYVGQPAAMFDNLTYTTLANAGYIDINSPQVASNSGQVVFVLAPPAVIAAAPQTMTDAQRVANAVFTAGDVAAGAVGLPALADIESFITGLGKEVVIGVAVTVGVGLVLRHMRTR